MVSESIKNEVEAVHQVRTNTCFDRYPVLFQQLKECCEDDIKALPILSYGCSTGEECFTLRDKYFQKTRIVGVDIVEENIEVAKNNIRDRENINFLFSEHDNLLLDSPYQAILCMSVLCRWPESEPIENIADLYAFNKFQSKLDELHSLLAIGGVLVIYNASFLFSDTFLYNKYDVFKGEGIINTDFVHKFDKNNVKMEKKPYREWIFIKKSH